MKINTSIFLLLIISISCVALAKAENQLSPDTLLQVRIENLDQEKLRHLIQMRTDIDGVWGSVARAYMFPDHFEKLRKLGYNLTVVPDRVRRSSHLFQGYHTHEDLTAQLRAVENAHPDICRLYNIGYSNEGRELWFMKISDNVDTEEDEPEFRYISAMHGDEPVGMELCLSLITLLAEEYGTDQQITTLVNEIEIWIMPLMNPDGYAKYERYNAQGADLNRDFPDRIDDPVNTPDGRQTETQHIMNWAFSHSTVLSANIHAGELVVNYPYDSDADKSAEYSATPDDDLFIHQSLVYSSLNKNMYNNSYFDRGIVNGAEWYVVYGGLQDWSYVWMGCNDVTIELNKVKMPPYSEIPRLWDDNREAMLAYMELCLRGVRGLVTDMVTGKPLSAKVRVTNIDHDVYTDPDVGDYHRMLLPGTYSILFSAVAYQSQTLTDVVIDPGNALRLDVALVPEGYSNHPPGFMPGDNQTVNEDAGQIIVQEWATEISPGPDYESFQKLVFNVSADNETLFAEKPAIDPLTGNLTYTPAENAYGSASVTVMLQDNGGTDNGGTDTSAPCSFTVTVTSVNDRPGFTAGPDQAVNEDTGMVTVEKWASDISPGPGNESDQKLAFEVMTDKDSLFALVPEIDPFTGNLSYTPAENAYGTALVKVTLKDSGGTENSGFDTGYPRIFSITVRPVNDAPVFIPGPDQVAERGAGPVSVSKWATNISPGPENESDQKLAFSIKTDNEALFAELPAADPVSGDLTYTPAPDAHGTAEVTVMLQDSGGTENSGTDTAGPLDFTITVRFLPGDTDGSNTVNMNDLVLALQILSGIHPSQNVYTETDVSNDGKIGTEEIIYILQTISGL